MSLDIEKVLKQKFEEEKEKVSETKVKKILNNVFKKIEEEEKRKSQSSLSSFDFNFSIACLYSFISLGLLSRTSNI